VAAAGCGGEAPALAPVRGTVYYKGAPVKGGVILFTPDEQRGGRGPGAEAVLGPDGTYVLRTGGERGATPGWHRITVVGAAPGEPFALPHRYADPELSCLCREVEAGRVNVIDLHLD
jgi:hypothetical protein